MPPITKTKNKKKIKTKNLATHQKFRAEWRLSCRKVWWATASWCCCCLGDSWWWASRVPLAGRWASATRHCWQRSSVAKATYHSRAHTVAVAAAVGDNDGASLPGSPATCLAAVEFRSTYVIFGTRKSRRCYVAFVKYFNTRGEKRVIAN